MKTNCGNSVNKGQFAAFWFLPPQLRLGNKLKISKLPSLSFPSGTKSGNFEYMSDYVVTAETT